MDNFLRVKGANLLNQRGKKIVLRGVNKMFVFEPDLSKRVGKNILPEIAKTGANCVRIAWGMGRVSGKDAQENDIVIPTTSGELDTVITNCKANGMIPVVGLWDFTGDNPDGGLSRLSEYVDFWISPNILAVLKKHEESLIINIANEASPIAPEGDNNDYLITNLPFFINQYTAAIQRMRAAGINVPLMIDGLDMGKSLRGFSFPEGGQTMNPAQQLLSADSLQNLIFSFHAYWNKKDTDSAGAFVENVFNQAVTDGYCFVIGELSKYGAFAGQKVSICTDDGIVDYLRFAQLCSLNHVGYILWEWGPGNEKGQINAFDAVGNPILDVNGNQTKIDDIQCIKMNMTTDGTFKSLNGWGLFSIGVFDFKMTASPVFRAKKGIDVKKELVGHSLTFTWNVINGADFLGFQLIENPPVGGAGGDFFHINIPTKIEPLDKPPFRIKYKTKNRNEIQIFKFALRVTNIKTASTIDIPLNN